MRIPQWTPGRFTDWAGAYRELFRLFKFTRIFAKDYNSTALRRLILPLVPRTSTSTTAGDTLLWQKSKDGPWLIHSCILEITTAGPSGLTLDVGIVDADDGTTDDSIFSAQPADAVGLFASYTPLRLNPGQLLTASSSIVPSNLTGQLYVAYMRAGTEGNLLT